ESRCGYCRDRSGHMRRGRTQRRGRSPEGHAATQFPTGRLRREPEPSSWDDLSFIEASSLPVFCRENGFAFGNRPWNGELWVIPEDSSLALWGVVVRDLIGEARVIAENGEAVAEAGWNPEHDSVLF